MKRPALHKSVVLVGHATFIILLVLAWTHAVLRTTSGDSGYQVFKWVNDAGLSVEAHRYSAIVPQLAVKAFKFIHADLKTLLVVASLSHVLVAYAVFMLCLYVLKAPRSAMGAALAAVLCTRLTFYGPVLEANYLLSYPFLFFAAIEGGAKWTGSPKGMTFLLLLAVPAVLVHPLGVGVLLFGVLFFWAWHIIGSRRALELAFGLAALFALVRVLFPPTVYEQGQYGLLVGVLHESPGSWASWDFLVGHTFHYTTSYLPAALVFLAAIGGLAGQGRAREAAALVIGVLSFLVLMLVTYRHGDTAMMMDRAFLPVAALIALPVSYLLWELRGKWATVGVVLLVLVVFIKVRDISFASRGLGKQFAQVEELTRDLERKEVRRAEVDERVLKGERIETTWALPYSTLLISSLQGPEYSLTVRARSSQSGADTVMDSPELDLESVQLNPRYFRLEAGPYEPWPSVPANP